MALINHAKKEIHAKLVYFGPPRAGKGTTLQQVYRQIEPDKRGKLKAMATQGDRMLFFDFLPVESGALDGYTIRFHLYTVPGEVTGDASWKMVLKGVDGVMFVADAAPAALETAREAFGALRELLAGYGRQLEDLPLVIQRNKADWPGAVADDALLARLGATGCQVVPTSATSGSGLLDALSPLVNAVMAAIGTETGIASGAPLPEITAFPPRQEPVPEPPAAECRMSPAKPEIELLPGVSVDGGRLRLPLLIRSGGEEKRMTLSIAITVEAGEQS